MSMIHGSWVVPAAATSAYEQFPASGYFLIWGEIWRSTPDRPKNPGTQLLPHPFAMTQPELQAALSNTVIGAKRWHSAMIALPTQLTETQFQPQLSSESTGDTATVLYPWQVEGFCLSPIETVQFLANLPLGQVGSADGISRDLQFWAHLVRWSLDLQARGKYRPTLQVQADGQGLAQWQVLLDSATDQERLNHFVQAMPSLCRLYQPVDEVMALPLPIAAKQLIVQFLNPILDAQIRQVGITPKINSPLQPWLAALTGKTPTLPVDYVNQMLPNLQPWLAPLAQSIGQFRACLTLIPPATGSKQWYVEYGLQAIADREYLVPAKLIWQNPVDRWVDGEHVLENPQETLLAGLGLASRIYPSLESSLQTAQPINCDLDAMQAYQFLRETAWRLQENGVGVVLPPSLANREGWANRLGLKVSATTLPNDRRSQQALTQRGMQGLLNFEWELSIGGHGLSKQEFDRLVALDMPLVEINGEWVELRSQDIRAAQGFFQARKDQTQLTLEDALRLSSGDTQTIEKLPVVSFEASGALQELVTNLQDNQSIAPIVPLQLNGELRPYQARGVGWLAFLEQWGLGACLADDMGLGKTLQLIAFVLYLKQEKRLNHPILIVCPTSVLGNWEREIKRFAPSLKAIVHHGEKRPQGQTFSKVASKYDLIITSYTLVQRDLNTLKCQTWQGLVLDEAQNIKNADAKQSQAVRQLDSQFRIALTGTPVENRLTELWSIMDFLNPSYLGPKQYFQRRFAIPIERYGDMTSLKSLRDLAQPFILRRLKTDRRIIQDLPEKQEINDFCGLTIAQADLYQQLVDQTLETIEAATGIQRKGMILALLTKLKQVCNHAGLINGKIIVDPKFQQQSGKLQRLEEMLDVVVTQGDRVLIFTQFAEWGKVMQQYLSQRFQREIFFLYGATTKNQREAMIERFQQDPQAPPIFILSLKAGGVGLNLTRANHVFHFDRWWNPAVENQATDRVFRIGQQRNVQVHKFICTGTLEERIHDMIESKKALAEQVIGTGENWLTELDTNQLRELLLLDRSQILGEEN